MQNLIGYRFHPTDEELISHYLLHKNFGDEALANNVINEVKICSFDPWELPPQSKIQYDEDDEQNSWYFFSQSSKRGKRTTKNGYWKPTGKDRQIKVCRDVIGAKKTLVFYKGRNPYGQRTSWVMHEYHSSITPPNKKSYVVCKLKNKAVEKNPVLSSDEVETSYPLPPDSDNHSTINGISEVIVQEEDFLPESLLNFDGLEFDGLDDCLDLDEHEEAISALEPKHSIASSYNHNAPPSQEIPRSDFQYLDVVEGQDDEFVNSLLADQDDEDCSVEENTADPIPEPSPRLYPENTTNTETEALNSSIETPASIRDNVSDYSEIIPNFTCLKDTNEMIFEEQSKDTEQMIFEESPVDSKIWNPLRSGIRLLFEFLLECSQISVSLRIPLGAGSGVSLNALTSSVPRIFENHFMQIPVQKFGNNYSSKTPFGLGKHANLVIKRSSSASQHCNVAKDSRFPANSRSQKHQVERQNKHQNLVSLRNHATALQIKFKHMKRTPRCSNLNSPMQKILKHYAKRTSCSSSLIQAVSTHKHPVLRKRVPALCYKEVF